MQATHEIINIRSPLKSLMDEWCDDGYSTGAEVTSLSWCSYAGKAGWMDEWCDDGYSTGAEVASLCWCS